MIGGYELPYFSKQKLLTKDHIISQFIGDEELLKYLPDQLNKSTVTREFLLALLFNVRNDKYLNLYNTYKQEKSNRQFCNGKVYKVSITNKFANEISEYSTTTK